MSTVSAASLLSQAPIWRVRDDVAWIGRPGHYVALSLFATNSPRPLALEDNAALVWEILCSKRGVTMPQLVDQVARVAGVPASVIVQDIEAFLSTLHSESLVQRVEP